MNIFLLSCSWHEPIIYRASGVKLALCGHGKGRSDLSAEHSMRITATQPVARRGSCYGTAGCPSQSLRAFMLCACRLRRGGSQPRDGPSHGGASTRPPGHHRMPLTPVLKPVIAWPTRESEFYPTRSHLHCKSRRQLSQSKMLSSVTVSEPRSQTVNEQRVHQSDRLRD